MCGDGLGPSGVLFALGDFHCEDQEPGSLQLCSVSRTPTPRTPELGTGEQLGPTVHITGGTSPDHLTAVSITLFQAVLCHSVGAGAGTHAPKHHTMVSGMIAVNILDF